MLTKKYLKTKPVCKVTFSVAKEEHQDAKAASLVGEFNDWKIGEVPMKKNKQGKFQVTLDLEKGKEYQFRYVFNNDTWANDWEADKYVPNNLTFEENSVVEV